MNNHSKKVFIVTEYIGLNHNSTAYYWAKLALYFDKYFELHVICPRTAETEAFFNAFSIQVTFVEDANFSKNKLFERVWGQVKYAWSLNKKIISMVKKKDLVFTGTNPIISVFFMALIKKIKRFKLMLLCHDIFPDNLIPSGIMVRGIKFNIVRSTFSIIYRTPDIILPIGRDMANKLKDKGVLEKKIVVIPNWAGHKKVKLINKFDNSIITKLGWTNNIVFCFFGNLGRVQGISNLLEAISLVKTEEARFLFIGDGAEVKKVIDFTETTGKHNSFYFGKLSLQDNSLGLNSGDVSLVTLSSDMYGLGVPSKAYFSMAADKPILLVGDVGSELELLLREYNLGWFCPSDDPQALASLIEEICEQRLIEKLQTSSRDILIQNFSEKKMLKLHRATAEELLSS